MLWRSQYAVEGKRDLRIDWLRGLAMTCVIIDHSKISSLLSWFSYQRFWVVTAAEVFVVLSGVVLGMVYGHKLVRSGWPVVIRGLGRRALTLYVAFVAVTLSVLFLSRAGIDVGSVTAWDERQAMWFEEARNLSASTWRDIALMRFGPWPFEIVGLYVWLVVAAVPCLVALRFGGWRLLLAVSWSLYLWHRVAPHPVTAAEFESTFPILAWQLLFAHGLAIGYHRDRISAFAAACPRIVPAVFAGASVAFAVLALCNPSLPGPSWLHWSVVSPARFKDLYLHYFALADLGIGRLLNLAVSLPVGYVLLTRFWALANPLKVVLVALGQQSLGAFVLHVYGIILLTNIPLPPADELWINSLIQLMLIVAIAVLLNGIQRLPLQRPPMRGARARPLPA